MEELSTPETGDVFLLAPLDDAGVITHSYLLLVETDTDPRTLLTELLGGDCAAVKIQGEEDALLFLRGGVVPCLLLVHLRVSTAEAWVLADVIRAYGSFGKTTIRKLTPQEAGGNGALADLLDLCAAASKPN